jgi:hypothetical protein
LKAATLKLKADEERAHSRVRGAFAVVGLCFCTSLLAARCPARVALAPALAPARGMLGRVLYAAAFFLLLIYTMDSQPTGKVEGVGDDFVRGGQDQTPIKQKRKRIVLNAGTPNVIVTEGNEQYSAPWTDESPGGTVTTSAYKDGRKRGLSAKEGSGDPRKKVLEQNKTFMKAHRKSGGRDLTEEEIRAEAQKRRKEMGDAARAAEMTKEEVALEKRKGLAEKEAARKAATGQAGKDKRAAGDAKRKAATGQAGKDKHAPVEAKRKAATRQAGTVKRAAEEAAR